MLLALSSVAIGYITTGVLSQRKETKEIIVLQDQLELSEKAKRTAISRAREADADNALLLRSLSKALPQQKRPKHPTDAEINDSKGLATALVKRGDYKEALAEYLWLWDEGMANSPRQHGVRISWLVSQIVALSELYPLASEALRQRRDFTEQIVLANSQAREEAIDYARLNNALNEGDRNVSVFDQLGESDSRRKIFASAALDQLIAQKRYSDALLGRTSANAMRLFEVMSASKSDFGNLPNPVQAQSDRRKMILNSSIQSIEILAGAGQLDEARKLSLKLLQFDNTDATRLMVYEKLERAGQSNIIQSLTGTP